MRAMIIVKCQKCSKEFSAIKGRGRRYCSNSCANSRDASITKKCVSCSKDFKTFKSVDLTYCSKACYNELRIKNKKTRAKNNRNKICKHCGDDFKDTSRRNHAVFCSKVCYLYAKDILKKASVKRKNVVTDRRMWMPVKYNTLPVGRVVAWNPSL